MTALLHSVARLFAAAAARPARSFPGRMLALAILAGVFFGLWRLAFAGLVGGGLPLSQSEGGTRLLVTEFGLAVDTLWSLSADDPARRQPVATLPHARGYGVFASLSPDGQRVAYTALPPGLRNPSADSPADLWLLDLSTGEARVLAAGADLLVAPLWAPDGGSVVFRRSYPVENAAGSFELVRVTLEGGQTVLAKADAALFPVSLTAGGALLYTAVSPAGTDLVQAPFPGRAAAAETLAHLSDDFTRDWRLSPDGQRLVFLAPRQTPQGMALRAMVADLSAGAGQVSVPILGVGDGPAQDFGPTWHPDGDLTLGRLSPGQGGAGALRLSPEAAGRPPGRADSHLEEEAGEAGSLPKPERGFDVPIAWSPDGTVLAVRTFEGSSPLEPGGASLELVEAAGGRRRVKMTGDFAVLGWLSPEATGLGESDD